jgi:Fe-Mn family superoxide dismutase
MTARNSNEIALHQNASMVWNHNFFWQCLTAEPVEPTDELLDIFDLHFNGIDKFMSKFTIHANALFGSGHTWLVDNDGQLEIVNTFNGQTMVGKPRITPLLVLNVWEHAYVIDYNERKREYIDRFFSRVNWQFVEDQLKNIDRSKRN